MRIVLDTNVLLVAISAQSEFHPIFDAFLKGEYTLCVTTDILMEYEEIITTHMGRKTALRALRLIENAANVNWITKYYKWNLIEQDADDNKFVDCAIACNAKFLVSDDKHFRILKRIPFPHVEVLKAEEFRNIL